MDGWWWEAAGVGGDESREWGVTFFFPAREAFRKHQASGHSNT